MCDMFRKELLDDELTFTKWGWIYQYEYSIPNNKDDKLTFHWMEKLIIICGGEIVAQGITINDNCVNLIKKNFILMVGLY